MSRFSQEEQLAQNIFYQYSSDRESRPGATLPRLLIGNIVPPSTPHAAQRTAWKGKSSVGRFK